MTQKPRPIVAELGRPETPEETAARKAQDSANHRNHQTLLNLILSLAATLVVVLIIVFIVPRAQPNHHSHVDYLAAAAKAQGSEPDALATPHLPKGWYSNAARLRTKTAGGVDSWYIGFVTPDEQYVGVIQGFDANRTWLSEQVKQAKPGQRVGIDGVSWTTYDNRDVSDHGNVAYALTTKAGHSTYVVFGTAPTSDIHRVARALTPDVKAAENRKAE